MQFVLAVRIIIKIVIYTMYVIGFVRNRINGGKGNGVKGCSGYESIRPKLRTGDIVLFSGKGIVSWAIRFMTKSPWSHVGMIIRHRETDPVLLFESTTLSKTKDLMSGKCKSGVQLTALSERLLEYGGKAGVVFLEGERTPEMLKGFDAFREEVRNRPYEQNFTQLFKSMYDGFLGGNRGDTTSLFCSELVAEALQRVGVLSNNIPSNEYIPADFDKNTPRPLPLMGDFRLSNINHISIGGCV